jgi:putative transposase
MRKQCELLSINRSSLYYKPLGETAYNLQLMRLMDEHYLKHPSAGVITMQDYLRSVDHHVNIKRIRRLLRLMGLMAIYPKRNLSRLGFKQFVHPYLLKNLTIDHPNQVWAIDITYIPMKGGFMYLTVILDVYSRFVVGWGISNTLEANATLEVLKTAIRQYGKPKIINSDQGCQFTCKDWVDFLIGQTIKISMDGKGRAIDNIYIERFFRTLKREHVYLNPTKDGLELYTGLEEYFHYYNNQRTHQGINRRVPVTLYQIAA